MESRHWEEALATWPVCVLRDHWLAPNECLKDHCHFPSVTRSLMLGAWCMMMLHHAMDGRYEEAHDALQMCCSAPT